MNKEIEMNSLIELKKFYEFKNKLLHATEHFMGFNPLISVPLEFPKIPASAEQILKHNFVVGDESFLAKFSCSASSNGCRVKRVEIYRQNKRIILIEKGTHGYGANYSKGINYYVSGDKAYLLTKGIWLKDFEDVLLYGEINSQSYYLLSFTNIVVPKKYPVRKIKPNKFPTRHEHVASKIKLWEGAIQTSEGAFHITCTTVLVVQRSLPQISIYTGTIEFLIDGKPYFFENI